MTDTYTPVAWDQRDNETAPAYAAFCLYKNLRPHDRSLAKAYGQHAGKDDVSAPGRWTEWSSKHEWVSRAKAWDRHNDMLTRSQANAAINDEMSRQRAVAAAIRNQVFREFMTRDLSTFSPGALARFLEVANGMMLATLRAPDPESVLEPGNDMIDAVIDRFSALAMSGDKAAADLIIKALDRKAKADGSDAPQIVGVAATLQMVLGGGSPDDLPMDLQRKIIEHYRAQDVIQAGE
jgi:hypothetical protein